MANSKAISIRVPDELLEKIDRLAEEKYKSHKGTPNRSLVVLDAIVAYFDTMSDTSSFNNITLVSDSVSVRDLNELRDVVNTLSDSLLQFKNEFNAVSDNLKVPAYIGSPDRRIQKSEQGQPSIIAVSDNVDSGLTATQLGLRLKEKPQLIGTNKKKPKEFAEWSKNRDPEGYGWKFEENTKLYHPIKSLV